MTARLGRPWLRAGLLLGSGLVILLVGVHLAYAGKVFPGVHAGPAKLEGRSQADAAFLVEHQVANLKQLRFTYQGKTYPVNTADIELRVDAKATAERAMAVGRGQGADAVLGPYRAALVSTEVPLVYSFNAVALREKLLAQTKDIGTPMQNAQVVREGTDFRIVPERSGTVVDPVGNVRAAQAAIENFREEIPLYVRAQVPDIISRALTPAKARAEQLSRQPFTITAGEQTFRPDRRTQARWISFERYDPAAEARVVQQATLIPAIDEVLGVGQNEPAFIAIDQRTLRAGVDRTTVGEYIADVAGDVDRPPVNARVAFTNGQLVISGQPKDGLVIDRSASVTQVAQAFIQPSRTTTLPIVAKPADIRQETLPRLGITQLIGSATTTFGGSPPNRTYNIGVGARRFDGVLIKPGQEFSFNEVLGDVGPETGYLPELVIKENKTVPEYGGGLCQVSTTTFRAALAAGLPITARTNHAYAVHYYAPIGMDATIYPPEPDLRFKNNTPGYILVQTRQAGTSLTYDFFGTSDGRKSSTEITSSNATEEGGGTASFRYLVVGGPDPIDRVFYSSYKPRSQFPTSRSLN